MMQFDYIIVGAGSAGCVLANRLSENPSHSVLLIESGPVDDSFLIRMPKGFGKTLADPRLAWHFVTTHSKANGAEVWVRGKTLGGSSSVNGMVYVRGQPQDYDRLAELGNEGWAWSDVAPYFQRLENHVLGADELRGAGGPVDITLATPSRLGDAMLEAGRRQGLPVKDDLNRLEQEGIGYLAFNINSRGERISAARAFLRPVRKRSNLTIMTDTLVERVLFHGKRAVGVVCRLKSGAEQQFLAVETILCAGALQSPKILQLSGVGPAARLQKLGIDVVHDSPGVGENMREHLLIMLQYHLKYPKDSQNREFSGLRLVRNVANYMLRGRGVMAQGSYQVGGFVKTDMKLDRPDAQVMFAPFSLDLDSWAMSMHSTPGMQFFGYPLRSDSQGSVRIQSSDPSEPAVIDPNYLATDHDRRLSVDLVRYMRRYMGDPVLSQYVGAEMSYTADAQTDDEILDVYRQYGQSGYHASGTCRMGSDELAVVDARLRVRGVSGVRVMDCSIYPELLSGNTNAPTMALAWRAADLILADAHGCTRSTDAQAATA